MPRTGRLCRPHYGKVLSRDRSWTVDAEKMALTHDAYFACLPVRRNMIVTDEVIESPRSLVIPEAANREISAQVVLKRVLEGVSDGKITVVKIGATSSTTPRPCEASSQTSPRCPGRKFVHGGGKLATRLAQKLELQVQMVDGRRITDKGTLDIVTMVYAGLVNKQLVAGLQAAGCNASAVGRRRQRCHGPPPHRNRWTTASWATSRGDRTTRCSGNFWAGVTPVFWPSCTTGRARCSTATPTAWLRPWHSAPPGSPPTELVFCFEKKRRAARPGRRDNAHPRNHGRVVRRAQSRRHRQQGMIPKVENALKAVANGVRSVTIKHSENLLNDTGTVIR